MKKKYKEQITEQEQTTTEQEPQSKEDGGYVPMTDKQIKKVRWIVTIVLLIVAVIIVLVKEFAK